MEKQLRYADIINSTAEFVNHLLGFDGKHTDDGSLVRCGGEVFTVETDAHIFDGAIVCVDVTDFMCIHTIDNNVAYFRARINE